MVKVCHVWAAKHGAASPCSFACLDLLQLAMIIFSQL